MKNKKMMLVLFLVIISLAGCKQDKAKEDTNNKKEVSSKQEKIKPVSVVKIEKKLIEKLVTTNSELNAIEEVFHMTKTGGDIEKIYYKNGDRVKEGDVVVKMKDSLIEADYKNSKANLDAAKSSYEKSEKFAEQEMRNNLLTAENAMVNAKETLERAKRGVDKEEIEQAESALNSAKKNYEVQKITYDKYVKLYEKKLISEIEFLNMENSYKSTESGYKQAEKQLEILKRGTDREDIVKLTSNYNSSKENYELIKKYIDDNAWKYEIAAKKAQYDSAQAVYESAKTRYEELTMKAKISGVVSNMDLTENTIIAKEKNLFVIINDNKMEGKCGVAGEDLRGIKIGKKIEVFIEDISKETEGVISEISPSADTQTRKFAVKFLIDNKEREIRKGMYGKVYIPTITKEVLTAKSKSIVIKDLASYLFTVENNIAKKIKVETGLTSNDDIEIISDKVKEGDLLVVEGQFMLEDQDKVKIADER